MIDFIAHDLWSWVWIASLITASLITWAGHNKTAHKISAIMWGNWLLTRLIAWSSPDNDMAWLALEFITVVALLGFCRGFAGKSIATLFTIILGFNVAGSVGLSEYAQTAAVADALGFLMLIIMAGAAHAGPNAGKPLGVHRGQWFGNHSDIPVVAAGRKTE